MWGGAGSYGHMWDGGWFGMGFGLIGTLLFWILIILGVAALVKWLAGGRTSSPPPKTALDIVKERYARGEIDKEEFEQKKRDLSS